MAQFVRRLGPRTLLIALAPLITVLLSAADTARDPATLIKVSHLKGPLYVIEDSFWLKENSIFYVGQSSVTLVGAGWSPGAARQIELDIQKITDKPVSEVVDTDFNPDRAGGNAYWKQRGVKVIATEKTAKLLKTDWGGYWAKVRKILTDLPQTEDSLPTVTYPGDFMLQDAKVKAFFLGPTHMPDDIFVYFPDERVLYAGNILKEQPGNLASADLDAYMKSLEKLKALHLDIDSIISGHWSPVHGPELIETYLGFLKEAAKPKL